MGMLKIASAIFLAAIALAVVGWGVVTIQKRSEKAEVEKYQAAKIWRADVKDPLQLDLVARTKLVDDRLRVALELDGYPAYLSHPRLEARNRNALILLAFEDADGFKIYEKSLKIAEFNRTVDANGKKIGLNVQFDDYLGVTSYKSFSRMQVRWTLQTAIPAEPKGAVAPTPQPRASTDDVDHCAPGLNRAERLRRLAKHGIVRQVGEDTYSVGHREVTFYSAGGGLLACQ